MPEHKAYPIVVRELEVAEAYDVTPGMRRVVVTGPQLDEFENNGHRMHPFLSECADDHVKLIIPSPEIQIPGQLEGRLDWNRAALDRARDYTPRRVDPERGLLELDFVRHEGGLASEWALTAQPGDPIWVAGPRGTTVVPDNVDWYLLIGDETALPAIARRIEELPAGTPVTAVVSIPSSADEQRLDHAADLDITWVPRDRSPVGAFHDAVRRARWREGQVYAWAAGEAGMLRPVRVWLKERGVPKTHTDIAGYWRAGESQVQAMENQEHLEHHADLSVPYALRAAVTLDLAEHVLDGHTDLEDLAKVAGIGPRGLRKLLMLLAHERFFTVGDDDTVGLTPVGAQLTDEFVHSRLDQRHGYARLDDAWPGLLHALRTGDSGLVAHTGQDFWSLLGSDETLGETFDDELSEWAERWTTRAVAHLDLGPDHVIDVGGGRGDLLAAVLNATPEATGTLVDLPTTLERGRANLTSLGLVERCAFLAQSFFEPIPADGDVYLLSQVLHDWPDAECVAILQRLAEAASRREGARVVLVERLPEPDPHDHDLMLDLALFATFGGGERSQAEYAELASRAGLALESVEPIGAELFLFTLRPQSQNR